MKTDPIRLPSANELLFIDLAELGYDMNQYFLIELDRKPPIEVLDRALDTLAETHQGMNLRYHHKRWYPAAQRPRCRTVTVPAGQRVMDCMTYHPNPRSHTFSLTLFEQEDTGACTLCFTVFHGAADGRSVLQLIYDYVAILNGTTPAAGEFSLTDHHIVKGHKNKNNQVPVKPRCQADGWTPGRCGGFAIDRIHTGTVSGSVAARMSAAVATLFKPGHNVIMLPVDLRRYAAIQDKFLYGNLILPLYFRASHDVDAMANHIREKVQNETVLSPATSTMWGYGLLPDWARRSIFHLLMFMLRQVPEFPVAALVSNIGRVDTARLKNPYFGVTDLSACLGSSYYAAFTIVSTVFENHTTICYTWQEGKVTDEAVAKLAEELQNKLS